MTFGTLGVGQIPYWGAVLFNAMAGIDALEIQYKNPADAVTDVITGRIDYYIAPPVVAIGSKDKLRVLAVTTRVRSEVLPDVPTIAETALTGYDMPAWQSIMGPAGMSAEVVQILNKAIARSLASANLRQRFLKAGWYLRQATPRS